MVIDHTNSIVFDHKIASMFLAGRTTFPLFCYAMAMVYIKAETTPWHYTRRLLILAILVQPFYYFSVSSYTPQGWQMGSIIFTLAGGSLMAALTPRLKLWQIYLLYAGAAFSMLWVFPVEFGLAGIMLPSAFLLALRGHKSVYPFLLLLLLTINNAGTIAYFQKDIPPAVWMTYLLIGTCSIVFPWMVLEIGSRLRQTGRLLPKYALHVFYPAHLSILRIFWAVFMKG